MTITSIGPTGPASASVFDRQVFTGPTGTWTKPTGAQTVRVRVMGGGSGGGSGFLGPTTSQICGGPGGAGGAYAEAIYDAGDLPASVSVVVGTGGAGGAGQTVSGPGVSGSLGEPSSFGTILKVTGPLKVASGGGNFTTAAAGFVGYSAWQPPGLPTGGGLGPNYSGILPGGGGQSSSQTTTTGNSYPPRNDSSQHPVGGSGGATKNGVTSWGNGGSGLVCTLLVDDNVQQPPPPGGTGLGVTPVASPKQLADTLYAVIPYYSGAGGGCCDTGPTGGTGGAGGNAQGYGAGGGGGGPGTVGFISGTGGRGAPGIVIVESFS